MKGEYVSLNVSADDKIQGLNITGVLGGSLRCDEPRPMSRRRGNRPEDGASTEEH